MFYSYPTVSNSYNAPMVSTRTTLTEKSIVSLSPHTIFSQKMIVTLIALIGFSLFISIPAFASDDHHENEERMDNDSYHMGSKGMRSRGFGSKHHKKIKSLEDAQKIVDSMHKRFGRRMERLRDKLNITATQESAWKSFNDARRMMIPTSADLMRMSQLREQGHTPKAAQSHLDNMYQHLGKFQNVVNSYDLLYKQSSEEQKKELARMHPHTMGGFFHKGGWKGKKNRKPRSDD